MKARRAPRIRVPTRGGQAHSVLTGGDATSRIPHPPEAVAQPGSNPGSTMIVAQCSSEDLGLVQDVRASASIVRAARARCTGHVEDRRRARACRDSGEDAAGRPAPARSRSSPRDEPSGSLPSTPPAGSERRPSPRPRSRDSGCRGRADGGSRSAAWRPLEGLGYLPMDQAATRADELRVDDALGPVRGRNRGRRPPRAGPGAGRAPPRRPPSWPRRVRRRPAGRLNSNPRPMTAPTAARSRATPLSRSSRREITTRTRSAIGRPPGPVSGIPRWSARIVSTTTKGLPSLARHTCSPRRSTAAGLLVVLDRARTSLSVARRERGGTRTRSTCGSPSRLSRI